MKFPVVDDSIHKASPHTSDPPFMLINWIWMLFMPGRSGESDWISGYSVEGGGRDVAKDVAFVAVVVILKVTGAGIGGSVAGGSGGVSGISAP